MDSRDILPPGFSSEDSISITGALDVDGELVKKDLSTHIEDNLSRLFECLKLEYGRRILVSPKWKNFGSQKLLLSEKTRLNNAIWRCWHIQYQKNKKPLFCQFVSPLSEEREPPKKPLAIILQGRFWRRKLDAIAREYKNWRTYYKQKSQEAEEEAKRERLRTLSTSSGDDEVSYGSPLTQMVNFMEIQLTTDMVHSHPDTLFTTKTTAQQNSKQTVPEATISEITFQPSLDSLQPNLDDFSKHIENLVDFLSQSQTQANESFQLPAGFDSSKGNIPLGTTQLASLPTRQPSQAPNMAPFQRQQNNIEMIDQSFELYNVPTRDRQGNQSNQQNAQRQDFMDTTENFQEYALNYDSQMEMQTFSPTSGQPLSHEGIPLEHLEEEVEQELYVNQNQSQSTVVRGTALTSPQKSPLPVLPLSPVQQIPGSHLQDPKLMTPSQTQHLPYSHSSGNLQEYGTSPVRRGRLPRNISDNQLSMNDSSHLGLGLSFLQAQETKIPTQVQFPNLVAHLQSSNVGQSDLTASATQAKRPRIPRNMSDSGLYDMLRTSKAQSSFEASLSQMNTMATSPPKHSLQQTPLEQIRAQAAQSPIQLLPTPYSTSSQNKHSRLRKGKLPRNMSDSSLTYMSNQQLYHQNMPLNMKGFPTHRKKSADSLQVISPALSLPSAFPVLSSSTQAMDPLASLQGAHPVYASSTLASSPPYDATKQGVTASLIPATTGASLYDQMLLDHDQSSLSSSSTSNTVPTKNVQSFAEHTQTTSLLSQLLQHGDNSSEPQKANVKEQETQMIKQLLQVVNKQSQLPSSNQQSPELMSLLQGVSPQQRTSDSVGSMITASTGSSQLYHILSQPEQPQQQQQQHRQQQQQQQLTQQQQQQHQQQQHQQQQQHHHNQQQQHMQISQQAKGKHQHQPTQVLEKQLQHQLLQQQQQLQQQAQENQKTSQLISALKSTSHVLQQQLGQPQQLQQLLEQQTVHPQESPGTFFSSNPRITTRHSNISIQPKPVTTQSTIAPYPRVSSGNDQGAQARVQLAPQQPGQVVTSHVQSSTPNLISLQQMLEGNVANQSGLKIESTKTVGFKTSGLPQQTTATNSSSFSFPQAFFNPGTMTTASATTNEPTSGIIGALSVKTDSESAVHSSTSPPTPKFSRPISASERENYKEHRRQSHITAEQKRRCNIKVGFDQLLSLVPALAHQKNSKVSKATILQKSVEYTTKLQRERAKMAEEEELLRKEIQSLHSSISACQQQLPASGVPVNRQRSDQMLTLYNQYVKTRTQENFKFWILSVIFRQMFEVYNQSVSTNAWQEFCANILSWLDEQCTLPNLRPAVLSALRDITRSTSILTEPQKFPEEIQHYVATTSDPSVIVESTSSSSPPTSTSTKRNAPGRNFFNSDGMS